LRPLRGAYAAAAPSTVSAIATIPAGDIFMTTFISALTRTVRRIRRSAKRLSRRLTRKAEIKLGITVSLPPFLKFALDYKANIGEPANDDTPHQPGRTA
jgi:hypothetical protein